MAYRHAHARIKEQGKVNMIRLYDAAIKSGVPHGQIAVTTPN